MAESYDRALAAFRRLLSDAGSGGQSKVDALVALAQRTVFVPTWKTGEEGYRTLTSSSGDTALPIFTDEIQIRDAAQRYGWVEPNGSVSFEEVGARKAFRHA